MKPWQVEVVEEMPLPSIGGPVTLPQWHIRLIGGNGEITMSSETYVTKASAKRAAARLVEAAKLGFLVKAVK